MICKPIFFFIFSCFLVKGQKPFKQEINWAVGHPFAALKIKKIHAKALPFYDQASAKVELDSFSNGGKLDAFRHTFFMAAFAQKIKIKKIRKLGIAHEKGNYTQFLKQQNENNELPDSLSNVMDLYNNELGFKIGAENKTLTLEELRKEVIKRINTGEAVILKRNRTGQYLDCNNVILDLKKHKDKWYVPKCLIPSNSSYID